MASFYKTSSRQASPCPVSFTGTSGPAALTQGIAAALLLFSIESVAQIPTEEKVNSTQLGTNAVARGGSVAIGSAATAEAPDNAEWDGSLAIGSAAHAGNLSAGKSTAVGTQAKSSGTGSIALGAYSTASKPYAVAVGLDAKASSESAVAIGRLGQANGFESIAIGTSSTASGAGAVAIGRQATANGARSVALGADSNATRDNSVDIGNRVITHVGAGTLETDAANIQQLKGVANALGGGAGVNATGAIIAPSYTVGKEVHRTVGGALTNLDTRVDKNASGIEAINTSLKNALANAGDIVSYENSTLSTVKFAGKSGTRLTNVAAGDISATSSDAINGAQIETLSKGFNAKIDGLDLRVASLEKLPGSGSGSGGTGTTGGNGGNGGNGNNGSNGSGGGNSTNGSNGTNGGNGNNGSNGSSGGNGTNGSNGTNGGNGNNGSNGSSGGNGTNGSNGTNGGNGNNGSNGSGGGNGTNGSNGTNGGNGNSGLPPGSIVTGPNGAIAIGAGSELPAGHALSVGAPGSERRITNVAAGASGTDAVNLNQLNVARQSAVEQSKSYTDLRFSQNRSRIDEVGRTAYAGVAMAMAMPNIAPAKAGGTVVAAGSAGFQGYAALGLGLTYRSPNGRMLLNGALAYSGSGGTAARVQAGYEF